MTIELIAVVAGVVALLAALAVWWLDSRLRDIEGRLGMLVGCLECGAECGEQWDGDACE